MGKRSQATAGHRWPGFDIRYAEVLRISVDPQLSTLAPASEAAARLGSVECPPDGSRVPFLRETLVRREARIGQLEALIREIDHRVKNSLQLLVSAFRLKAIERMDLPELRDEFDEAATRIEAIARVHDILSCSTPAEAIDLGDYLHRLAAGISALPCGRHAPAIEVEAIDAIVDASKAVAIALIASELVSNACKHGGWQDRTGLVLIRLARSKSGTLALSVTDDGRGLPASVATSEGFGLRLVRGLAQSLGAEVSIAPADGRGTCLVIDFPAGIEVPSNAAPDREPTARP